jgi:hypothetical protein
VTYRRDALQSSFDFAAQPAPPDTTSTFSDNMTAPIHRWFRYSAGFSASWVHRVIEEHKANGKSRVLDPFAGSGTVLLEAERSNLESIGLEPHPFVSRIAEAKMGWRERPAALRESILRIMSEAQHRVGQVTNYNPLVRKCFPIPILESLDAIKQAWEAHDDGSPVLRLAWLALTSSLRDCSPVGTAQWQYILPSKLKAKTQRPAVSFGTRGHMMAEDMETRQRSPWGPPASVRREDARSISSVPDGWADLVITSPPYANNYDYADATRLEMSFFGEIRGWGDLQEKVRNHLIRSCTQHVASVRSETASFLKERDLEPIADEIGPVCSALEAERGKHGGRKDYHTMVAAYFLDMARVWLGLRRVTAPGAVICFVIGDSAPYGIYVPVDDWLGRLAIAAGFNSYAFERTRDRNTKWLNRKHRVPLKEGRLWIRG